MDKKCSLELTSISVGLTWHGWLFKDTHFVASDPPKLNDLIKIFLMNLNIVILYHAFFY